MNRISAHTRLADFHRRRRRAARTRHLDHDTRGRVWRKTIKRGTGTVGPHQVTTLQAAGGAWAYQWDARGNQTVRDAPGTANDRTIQYSLDDHAYEIVTGNGQRTRYWYGPDGQRYQREDADGSKTLYVGQVEVLKQGASTRYRRNLGGVLVRTEQGTSAEDRFVFTDRLGSVVKYTDGSGTVFQPQDFDGWGGRRSTTDPTQAGPAPTPPIALRGYTGHEMVDGQDVIHMNARLYDPMLGRFLQADPLIQAPENLQSWNAYTYVLNNPLTLVDPTGMFSLRKFLGTVIGLAISIWTGGLAVGLWATTLSTLQVASIVVAGSFAAGAIASNSLKGGLIGAFSALMSFGAGAWFNGWGQIAAQAVSGGITELLSGGHFGNGFMAAGLTAVLMPGLAKIKSAYGRAAVGALLGGAISEATGGKFANGAVSGAIQGAMAGGARAEELGSGAGSRNDVTIPEEVKVEQAGFATRDEAAKAFGSKYYGLSDSDEFITAIVKVGDGWGYLTPGRGPAGILRVGALYAAYKDANFVMYGWAHTHPNGSYYFSGTDVQQILDSKSGEFYVTNWKGETFNANHDMIVKAMRQQGFSLMHAPRYVRSLPSEGFKGRPVP